MKKVKEIKQYNGKTLQPDIEPDEWFLRMVNILDENGNQISETVYDENEAIENQTLFKFNQNNQLIEKKVVNSEDDSEEHFYFEYNEEGKLVKQILKYADGSLTLEKIVYQQNEVITYISDEDNNFEGSRKRILNENNLIAEEIVVDDDNNVAEHFLYEYNDAGFMSKKTELDENLDILSVRTMKYDEKGNLTEILDLTPDGDIINQRNSEYNDQNQPIKEVVDDYVINYYYNEAGKRVKDEIINPKGDIESLTEYDFDEDRLVQTISFNKGNIRFDESNIKSLKSLFIISRLEYSFYD